MDRPLKVLICDDSLAIHESLKAYFNEANIECISAFDGIEAIEKFKEYTFDIIILDIMMPKKFGTEVCREIRAKSNVPIIMLSSRGDEFDRIHGLEIGADDYITKPFSPREVVARIHTILKRTNPISLHKNMNEILTIGEMSIDVEGYTLKINHHEIEMTPKELEILILLARNKNKVLSRESILNRVWGNDYFGDTRAVDTLIKRIRQKLPSTIKGFELKSIYGVGYKLEVNYEENNL
jgi:DNA-binding response OmpR family regulator